MPATPGSASKINSLKGVAKVLSFTNAELTSLGTKVFDANILLKGEDGKIYITDGVKALNALTPIVDTAIQPISSAAKNALDITFAGGTYQAAEGGMVVLGSGAKIADAQLNVVADGKIVESYLSDFVDTSTHMIKLDKLPDAVRAHVNYFADITARNAATEAQKTGLCIVMDASADPTVTDESKKMAGYVWDKTAKENAGDWVKIFEAESMDIDLDALTPNYEHVQAAGAVMYDHTISLDAPSLTEYSALVDASQPGD